jgi:uncharacterized protein (TIGR00369 family)
MDASQPMITRERLVTWEDPHATAMLGRTMSGMECLAAMGRGELPPPPVMRLLGMTLGACEPGRIEMHLEPGEYHYNPIGSVHGGVAATILDSVMGCAVHTTLPVGRGYTTLEIKINYVAAMTVRTGRVTAIGTVSHSGRQTAVAEARLVDANGKLYATGSTTCLVFDLPTRAA